VSLETFKITHALIARIQNKRCGLFLYLNLKFCGFSILIFSLNVSMIKKTVNAKRLAAPNQKQTISALHAGKT
jgi:hypothetical protein